VSHKEFVQRLRKKMQESLAQKTGWGRNEILHEFDVVCLLLLAEIVDEKKY